MSHNIEISADEQTYILNGVSYSIEYPILLALEEEKNRKNVKRPIKHVTHFPDYNVFTNSTINDTDVCPDYFDLFMSNFCIHNFSPIKDMEETESQLSESSSRNNSLYISECSDDEIYIENDRPNEDDKENTSPK